MIPLKGKAVQEYTQHFSNGDRREIFELLVNKYEIQSAIYPGSYIHIAPSLYIPITVYIDTYKKVKDFFRDKSIFEFIYKNRTYKKQPVIRFHHKDYNSNIGETFKDFDLLISQYGGFISQSCKKYLKKGGILLANNNHGDASMAYLDEYYEFIGVIYRSNRHYRLTEKNLDKYFIPKKSDLKVTKSYLEKIQRGIGYTKTASTYIFRNLSF